MSWVRWFRDVTAEDVGVVGGKNASLGEMLRELSSLGVQVPNGFAVTADAYRYFLRKAELERPIRETLAGLDPANQDDLVRRSDALRAAISRATLPPDLVQEIQAGYEALSRGYEETATDVAIRSSATAEDLPNASFAGQQESFLNVRGAPFVADAVKMCFASLFTPRAIRYRQDMGFGHMSVALSEIGRAHV